MDDPPDAAASLSDFDADIDDPRRLAELVAGVCRLHGDFVLRSGERSDTYFDKYLFESDPRFLHAIAQQLVSLVPSTTEVLAGLELGGVPVVTALSLVTGIPAAFVRKEAKTYGTAKLAEGADIDGREVLVVEDVITTGGQVARSVQQLRDRGATVNTVLCVINRATGTPRELDGHGLELRALLTGDQFE